MNLKKLKSKLHEGIVTVTFTKVNGETRAMPCTLNADLIPADQQPIGAGKHHSNEVLPVFCTDKQAWRSFRVDSVVSFK